MFKKVLIAEDLDSVNQSIIDLFYKSSPYTKVVDSLYCDDAYLKLLSARNNNDPFDLLITDLSFKKDYREEKLKSGLDLVEAIRQRGIEVKIIVYTVEDRSSLVKKLLEDYVVNAYVGKGRNGLKELNNALKEVEKGNTYLSQEFRNTAKNNLLFEIEEYDLLLLNYVAEGYSQIEISERFKKDNVEPNSPSSVEKRLIRLKDHFDAKNAAQLVGKVKDLGII